jgi:hypothetical protein
VRLGACERLAGERREQPHETGGAVIELHARKEIGGNGSNHAGKCKTGSSFSEVSQGAALHVDEGFFTRGMHDFEDDAAPVGGLQKKIVIIFARQGMGGGRKPVQITSDSSSLGGADRRGYARFGHHGKKFNRGQTVGQTATFDRGGRLPSVKRKW